MKRERIIKKVGLALTDYDMIKEGDRIVAGVSGGMDSVALFLILHERLRFSPVKYTLLPVLVDNLNGENAEYNKKIERLKVFLIQSTGCELSVIRIKTYDNLLSSDTIKKRDYCYYCARRRRTELIKWADANSCNKIALGHHLDDLIETTLMNAFYKGELSSMVPRLPIFDGKMELIRPLIYLEKPVIEDFVYNREEEIPVFGEICPSKAKTINRRRDKVREIIRGLETQIPGFKQTFFDALRNTKPDYLPDFLYKKR